MTFRPMLRSWPFVALLSLAACNAADVSVFSQNAGGSAGMAGSAGNAGMSGGSAGMPGMVGGGAGMSGGDTGGGGASAGQGGDAAAGGGETVCHGNAECPTDTFFCQTKTCEHGAPGVCAPRQAICEDNFLPVCGCDRVTYWNECYAEQNGATKFSEGPCGAGAKMCHGNIDCMMFGATCSRLLPNNVDCGTPADQGTCWVAPKNCAMSNDMRHWQSCPPPSAGGAGGSGPCISTCEAINSGRPSTFADTAVCP